MDNKYIGYFIPEDEMHDYIPVDTIYKGAQHNRNYNCQKSCTDFLAKITITAEKSSTDSCIYFTKLSIYLKNPADNLKVAWWGVRDRYEHIITLTNNSAENVNINTGIQTDLRAGAYGGTVTDKSSFIINFKDSLTNNVKYAFSLLVGDVRPDFSDDFISKEYTKVINLTPYF